MWTGSDTDGPIIKWLKDIVNLAIKLFLYLSIYVQGKYGPLGTSGPPRNGGPLVNELHNQMTFSLSGQHEKWYVWSKYLQANTKVILVLCSYIDKYL